MDRKEEKQARPSIISRLSGRFEGGAETMVVLHGERTATVYGCRRIVLYTPPEIRLAMRHKTLSVLGDSLVCTSFSGGTVTVEGEIRAVRYLGKTEAADAT